MKTQLKNFALIFIPLLLLEFTFRLFEHPTARFAFQLRSFIYVLFLSLLLFIINTLPFRKISKAITILTIMFISIYIFIQVGMRDYYGSFFSYRFLIKGTPDVQSYALDFVKFLKPQHFVFLLYGIVGSILYLKYTQTTTQHVIIPLLLTISSFGLYVSTLILMDPPHILKNQFPYIKTPTTQILRFINWESRHS